jgi:hypothetical protein
VPSCEPAQRQKSTNITAILRSATCNSFWLLLDWDNQQGSPLRGEIFAGDGFQNVQTYSRRFRIRTAKMKGAFKTVACMLRNALEAPAARMKLMTALICNATKYQAADAPSLSHDSRRSGTGSFCARRVDRAADHQTSQRHDSSCRSVREFIPTIGQDFTLRSAPVPLAFQKFRCDDVATRRDC